MVWLAFAKLAIILMVCLDFRKNKFLPNYLYYKIVRSIYYTINGSFRIKIKVHYYKIFHLVIKLALKRIIKKNLGFLAKLVILPKSWRKMI